MEKTEVITEKKLDFLLGTKSVQDRTRPAPSPTAQYTTVCAPGTDRVVTSDTIIQLLSQVREKNSILHAIGYLLFTYGLRVSEVLSIQATHLRNGEKIWIGGKKRSGDRYINYSEIRNVIIPRSKSSGQIFQGYSRFWVYREFKKLGIVLVLDGGKKKAVTHAGRHLVARELKGAGDKVESIQGFYQHKSIKSTNHYAKQKKQAGKN